MVLDKVQARYGWTDDVLLDPRKVRLSRWLDIVDTIAESEAEAARESLQTAAFIGWQVVAAFGGRQVGDFGTYLRSLNLEGPAVKPGGALRPAAAPGVTREEAMAKAEAVLDYFRKHKARKLGKPAQQAARARRRAARLARRASENGR